MKPQNSWKDHWVALRDGRGPERTYFNPQGEDPNFTRRPVGFQVVKPEPEPQVWEGDGA